MASLLTLAATARARGDADGERRLLDDALERAPGEPRILNGRGLRALADGAFEQARRCFREAVAADPAEPSLCLNLATACRQLKDDAGEEAALEQALTLDRTILIAHVRLAELHERLGRPVRATQSWSGVVQLIGGLADPTPAMVEIRRRGEDFLDRQRGRLERNLEEALAPDIARLGGDARRFAACMDHILGRRAIYRNECAGVHYPFLPADEFFDRSHFPWLPAIEAQTEAIRREALALLEARPGQIRPYVEQERGTPYNKWTPLDGSLDWGACFLWNQGSRNEEVCALCPATAAALETVPQRNHIPGKAPTAFFSILKPGAHIPPHTGVTNTRAIVHLPLVVPDGCRFRVGGETRIWEEGRAFAFDDTIEHEAWNDSPHPRIVLIFDVWNPYLTDDEQGLLHRFFEMTAADGER